MSDASSDPSRTQRVFVAGATGYIGRYVVGEFVQRGYDVVAFARSKSGVDGAMNEAETRNALAGAEVRFGDVTDAASVRDAGVQGESFDAVVSCLASRTGGLDDAWRIEHQANVHVLEALQEAGAGHFVLLSAMCVQKPKLEFQRAKLAFEDALVRSGMTYSIVRPSAFFKSISGQVERVHNGKAFLVFGDGELSACKPISEADLARYIADCLVDPDKRDAILPIGGPGPALTPKQQGELLFELLGRPPKFRRVPVGMFDAVIAVLAAVGRLVPSVRDKAEFARIGRYYATESMLVIDPATDEYDEASTPSFGRDTLRDHYARVLEQGLGGQELGDQALFARSKTAPDRRRTR